jgi:hypothetical protein
MYRWVSRAMSPRKFRFLVCACCASVWDELSLAPAREAAETLERYADGLASVLERDAAYAKVRQLAAQLSSLEYETAGGWGNVIRTQASALDGLSSALDPLRLAPVYFDWRGSLLREPHCHLLRCLVGNPFRPVAVDPVWLAWNGACVPRLAREIYEQRRYEDLPVLADALEDAGCTDHTLLDHCRRATVHARGCHVLDLLLGKR